MRIKYEHTSIVARKDIFDALKKYDDFYFAAKSLGISSRVFADMYYSYIQMQDPDIVKENKCDKPKDLFYSNDGEYEEYYTDYKQYNVNKYIKTVGIYRLPNGQIV